MKGPVYPRAMQPHGTATEIPPPGRRAQINDFIFAELVYGKLNESTRASFREVIEEGQRRGADRRLLVAAANAGLHADPGASGVARGRGMMPAAYLAPPAGTQVTNVEMAFHHG